MIESVRTCFRKYADFTGRARRSEYWWFFLFTTVVGIGLNFVPPWSNDNYNLWSGLFQFAVVLPTLAVGARRLHDTGRSGWRQLIVALATPVGVFLVFIGLIFRPSPLPFTVSLVLAGAALIVWGLMVYVWLALAGQPGPNQYGPPPYEVQD